MIKKYSIALTPSLKVAVFQFAFYEIKTTSLFVWYNIHYIILSFTPLFMANSNNKQPSCLRNKALQAKHNKNA